MTRVLVFDSGLGGLTVWREIVTLMPDLDLTYLADDKSFPIGDWPADALRDHLVALLAEAIGAHAPDCVVIACNTASTLVLPALRERFDIPFVGTVPAIKPAAEATRSGLISVLATPGTVRRDYTRALVDSFAAGCSVTLVGSSRLAGIAERSLQGERLDDAGLRHEIAPCFVETEGGRTDHVVLACTHFPLLLTDLIRLAPWPVAWIDPAPAIARRLKTVLGDDNLTGKGVRCFHYTSGAPQPAAFERFAV